MENAFCFTQKALYVFQVFKYLYFRLPFFFPVSATTEFVGETYYVNVRLNWNLQTHTV